MTLIIDNSGLLSPDSATRSSDPNVGEIILSPQDYTQRHRIVAAQLAQLPVIKTSSAIVANITSSEWSRCGFGSSGKH